MEELEARLKAVETAVEIMAQKRVLVLRTIVVNFGMHGFIEASNLETGIVVRDMIPVTGKFTKVHLLIESIVTNEKERKLAELLVAIEDNNQTSFSRGIKVSEGYQSASIFLDVVAGSRLIVKSNKQLFGVWYGLTIEPSTQHKAIESINTEEIVE